MIFISHLASRKSNLQYFCVLKSIRAFMCQMCRWCDHVVWTFTLTTRILSNLSTSLTSRQVSSCDRGKYFGLHQRGWCGGCTRPSHPHTRKLEVRISTKLRVDLIIDLMHSHSMHASDIHYVTSTIKATWESTQNLTSEPQNLYKFGPSRSQIIVWLISCERIG